MEILMLPFKHPTQGKRGRNEKKKSKIK